jgi:hypothetical protein
MESQTRQELDVSQVGRARPASHLLQDVGQSHFCASYAAQCSSFLPIFLRVEARRTALANMSFQKTPERGGQQLARTDAANAGVER